MERSIGWFAKEGMSEDELRHALAHELGVPFVVLTREHIATDALTLIPEPLSREHNVLAYHIADPLSSLAAQDSLEVALLDIADLDHLEFLRARYRLLPRLTSRDSMIKGLQHYQRHLRDLYGKKLEDPTAPHMLDTLLHHALHSRATDVHLQYDDAGLLVRYRINSSLRDAMTLPRSVGEHIITTLRSLAGVPGGTLPREGKLLVDMGGGEDLSVRVSSVPIVSGEKLVLHLVREKARRGHTLESLGLHGEALEAVHKTLLSRRGLIAVQGGTESGISTLLYTLLDVLNTPEISIATVEDHVEYRLPRVAQTEVSASGISAVAAVRAALKQDCDVLMISRVESSEVARIVVAAASRGVLVLAGTTDESLFATPDLCIKTVLLRQLSNKQLPDKYKVLRAQADRLEARADFAKVLAVLKDEGKVAKELPWKEIQFVRPVASTEHPTGYDGYIGVQEVVHKGAQVGLSLVEDALYKAAGGLTSLEEVEKLL